jgi:hypothetical protein
MYSFLIRTRTVHPGHAALPERAHGWLDDQAHSTLGLALPNAPRSPLLRNGSPGAGQLAQPASAVFGQAARSPPHLYAGCLLLFHLGRSEPISPGALLDRLYAAPDAGRRQQVEAAWHWLYSSEMMSAQREAPGAF